MRPRSQLAKTPIQQDMVPHHRNKLRLHTSHEEDQDGHKMLPRPRRQPKRRRLQSARKIIAVVGATGAQGGGLAALLNDTNGRSWRAPSPNVNSDKARRGYFRGRVIAGISTM